LKLSGAAARRFLEKPNANVALLFGPNRSLVAEAARALIEIALHGTDDPFALSRLSDDDLKKDKAALGDALAAQSLLGGPRVAWVRIDGAAGEDQILSALANAEAGAPGAFLVIEGGELSASSKLVKAFEEARRAVVIGFYEESAAERTAFVRSFLDSEGIAASRDVAEALVERLPDDRALARCELEKLAIFAKGDALSTADLDALLPSENDAVLDEAVHAATDGRGSAAQEALARIAGLSGVTAIKALERRLLRLLEVRTQMDQGVSAADAAARLRPPLFWKERDRFQSQLGVWSTQTLARALEGLWNAELAAKQAQSPQALLAADAFANAAKLARR
jgi:DNA polymerase-3 subunit delta